MTSTLQKFIFFLIVSSAVSLSAHAQQDEANDVTGQNEPDYLVVIDEPYNINRLWIHAQPAYVDAFIGSLNVGFGLKVEYQALDKLQVQVSGRRAYGENFDLTYSRGANNNDYENTLRSFHFFQGLVSYSLYDSERELGTNIVLTNKELEAWEIGNAKATKVPSMVREVIAVRGGGYQMQTSVDAKDALAAQGQDVSMFQGTEGADDLNAFTSFKTRGVFLGGSYTQIRNVAVRGPQQLKEGANSVLVNDGIFTLFGDVMYSPDQVIRQLYGINPSHDLENLSFNDIGWRVGAEMKYNRDFYWSYGVEIGSHTAIDKRSGYVLLKLGFPVVSYKLEKKSL